MQIVGTFSLFALFCLCLFILLSFSIPPSSLSLFISLTLTFPPPSLFFSPSSFLHFPLPFSLSLPTSTSLSLLLYFFLSLSTYFSPPLLLFLSLSTSLSFSSCPSPSPPSPPLAHPPLSIIQTKIISSVLRLIGCHLPIRVFVEARFAPIGRRPFVRLAHIWRPSSGSSGASG